MVVSARLHCIILGFLLHRTAISIAYNQKNDSIMYAVGLDAYCNQIGDFDPMVLAEQVQALEKEHTRLIPVIAAKISEYRTHFEATCCSVFLSSSEAKRGQG